MNFLTLNNDDFSNVRVLEVDNEPWFVGRDVCEYFGDTNSSRTLSRVDEDDKVIAEITDALGRPQPTIIVNESGLYSIIFAMQPQKANKGGVSDAYPIEVQNRIDRIKKFKHWVTSEVLPAIRKTGTYNLPMNYETALEQLLAEVKKNNQLVLENEELKESVVQMDRVIGEMKPKVDYCDVILSTTECMTTSQVAQDYGMSAKRFNSMLNHLGIQHRISDQWLLYSKYLGKGYTKTRVNTYKRTNGTEGSKPLTVWTQKGRMFLYEELKRYGVLPSMECEA